MKDIAISEEVLAKNHPDLAASYHNLSWVYRDMKDFPTALTYAQKAVEILQSVFPNGHPNLDKALINLDELEGKLRK